MSRKLHISARAGLLLALCCFPGFAEDHYIIHTKGDAGQIARRYGLTVVKSVGGSGAGHYVLASSGRNPQEVLHSLAADAGVQAAEADKPVLLPGMRAAAQVHPAGAAQGAALPLDGSPTSFCNSVAAKGYVNQPAAGVIQVTQAHGISCGGAKVAIIDTGIDRNNLVLAPSIGLGWDFVNNLPLGQERVDINQETTPILDQETTPILDQETTPILDGGSAIILNQETTPILDQETTPILDQETTPILDARYPAYGHGTMVSGLVHLVAPNATLLAVRAFAADGTSTISQIVAGIYWAKDRGAQVINMSFSTKQNSNILMKAIDDACKDIVCIAAAGNDGGPIPVWPAAYQNVIGVGSTNNADIRSLFSNYGSAVSLAAPGEALITTYPSSTTKLGLKQHYAEVWGTSFSAPLATGTAALLVNIKTRIGEEQAASILSQSAVKIGRQDLGAGELNAYQAALQAKQPNNENGRN